MIDRVDDKQEDVIQEEKRAAEKRANTRAGERFREAMTLQQSAQARARGGRRSEKDMDLLKEGAARAKAEGKRAPKEERVPLDSLLETWRGEEREAGEHRVSDKRLEERIQEVVHEEDGVQKEENRAGQEEGPGASRQLDNAVVGPAALGSGGGGGGSDFSGASSDGQSESGGRGKGQPFAELDDAPEAARGGRGKGMGELRLSASAAGTFSSSLFKRGGRLFPETLYGVILKHCALMVEEKEESVELVLSRYLFEGMHIRISAERMSGARGMARELSLELITHSRDVFAFFDREKGHLVDELKKRGLAVDLKRVKVSLLT